MLGYEKLLSFLKMCVTPLVFDYKTELSSTAGPTEDRTLEKSSMNIVVKSLDYFVGGKNTVIVHRSINANSILIVFLNCNKNF